MREARLASPLPEPVRGQPLPIPTHKVCTNGAADCVLGYDLQPFSNFALQENAYDGVRSECKACCAEREAARRRGVKRRLGTAALSSG